MSKGPDGKAPRPSPAMMGKFGKKISQDTNLLRKTDPPKAPDAPKPPGPPKPKPSKWDEYSDTKKAREEMPNFGKMDPSRRRHILDGDWNDETSGGHRFGTGRPGKTEFPESWTANQDRKVDDAINDIINQPGSAPLPRPKGGWEINGQYEGVNIKVLMNADGSIWAAHPISGPGVFTNP